MERLNRLGMYRSDQNRLKPVLGTNPSAQCHPIRIMIDHLPSTHGNVLIGINGQ